MLYCKFSYLYVSLMFQNNIYLHVYLVSYLVFLNLLFVFFRGGSPPRGYSVCGKVAHGDCQNGSYSIGAIQDLLVHVYSHLNDVSSSDDLYLPCDGFPRDVNNNCGGRLEFHNVHHPHVNNKRGLYLPYDDFHHSVSSVCALFVSPRVYSQSDVSSNNVIPDFLVHALTLRRDCSVCVN
jgi:hypothetical protein